MRPVQQSVIFQKTGVPRLQVFKQKLGGGRAPGPYRSMDGTPMPEIVSVTVLALTHHAHERERERERETR